MSTELQNKTIAFLMAPAGVEQVELTTPWQAVLEAGGTPHLIAASNEVQAFNGDVEQADTFPADIALADANPSDFDGLVLPGGTTNPDKLRLDRRAMDFVRQFIDLRRPVAAICHGPWSLVEAGVLPGKKLTSWPSLATDIRNAGGEWVDEQVCVCDHDGWMLVTSRNPDDLPAFCDQLVRTFASARSQSPA